MHQLLKFSLQVNSIKVKIEVFDCMFMVLHINIFNYTTYVLCNVCNVCYVCYVMEYYSAIKKNLNEF